MSNQSVNAFQSGAGNEASKNSNNMFPVSALNVMNSEAQGNVFPVNAMLPAFANQGTGMQG